MINSWLPLTDYSTKYKVSVSTLRRRIKAEDIQFRFQDGKYLIFDEPPTGSQPRASRPSLNSEQAPGSLIGSVSKMNGEPRLEKPEIALGGISKTEISLGGISKTEEKDEPILLAANKLLNELKKAYTQILQEKEEQILQLKEEVSDLKTLVKVLESEHSRARRM